MKRHFAFVKNGSVVNIALFGDVPGTEFTEGYDAVVESGAAGIGDLYDTVAGIFTKVAPELPPAPPVREMDSFTFLRLLTAAERIAARAAAKTDPTIEDFMHLLDKAPVVSLDDQDTVAGVNYLEQQGLIAAGRAAEILS